MIEPTNDPAILETWVGREHTATDMIDPVAVRRLEQTLDREPTLRPGDPLPPMWHTLAFADVVRQRDLGPDGHPKRGGFLPPVALPRRMWAGSRIEYVAPLPIGATATRASTIEKVVIKQGSTGTLCFVTVNHRTAVGGEVCMIEAQDLVYRDDPAPDAPPPTPKPAPTDADVSETFTPSEVQLFRYSALTFNGHRIHYDRTYAHEVEGYDGLVVHGPLTAAVLADLAIRTAGPLTRFSFRGTSPLLDGAPFTVHARHGDDGMDLWATTPAGGLAMTATSAHER
ncbi:MAG: MaoC family dehydratase N-terminal domain-containing protein [Actinomycetota bacterium]